MRRNPEKLREEIGGQDEAGAEEFEAAEPYEPYERNMERERPEIEEKVVLGEARTELEKLKEKPVMQVLQERAEVTGAEIQEISSVEKKKLFDSAVRISKNIPEVIITGGTALRIHLENSGKRVPAEFGRDIDCVIDKEGYERVRDALPPRRGKEAVTAHPSKKLSFVEKMRLRTNYRRKGDEEKTPFGIGNFLGDPEKQMAIEDKKNYYHIDLFPRQEITTQVPPLNFKGQRVSLLSPEELFLRRVSSIRKGIESGELQRRHLIYFYLNGGIIEEAKMDKLWEDVKVKAKEEGKEIEDWREIWRELDKTIHQLEAQGKIKEEVVH